MRYQTESGGYVTAPDRSAAAAMAAEYGFGALVAAAPAKPRKPMTVRVAFEMREWAHEFPRHGAGWPMDDREVTADRILAAAGYEEAS